MKLSLNYSTVNKKMGSVLFMLYLLFSCFNYAFFKIFKGAFYDFLAKPLFHDYYLCVIRWNVIGEFFLNILDHQLDDFLRTCSTMLSSRFVEHLDNGFLDSNVDHHLCHPPFIP